MKKRMEILRKYYNTEAVSLKKAIEKIIEVEEVMKGIKYVSYTEYSSYRNLERAKSSFKSYIDGKISELFFIDDLSTKHNEFELDKIANYSLDEYLEKHHSSIEKEIMREKTYMIKKCTANKTNTIFKHTYPSMRLNGRNTLDYRSIKSLMKVLHHVHGIDTEHGYIANLEFNEGYNDFEKFSIKIYKNSNFDIKIKK